MIDNSLRFTKIGYLITTLFLNSNIARFWKSEKHVRAFNKRFCERPQNGQTVKRFNYTLTNNRYLHAATIARIAEAASQPFRWALILSLLDRSSLENVSKD